MKYKLATVLLLGCLSCAKAQSTYVDSDGIWRYSGSEKKIAVFGVNYAPAFAHSYRRMQQLDLDRRACIRNDVYHFSRLGLDAYRVHVWDIEITDRKGDLLENDHLDVFDYLVAELKKRNINIVLTPLALIGNGYPDGPGKTPGFANAFDKQACSHDPEAIQIQANYLRQFMEHINPYTQLAYKDDPSIIGIELNNEPWHIGTPEQSRTYIQTLIDAVRDTGFKNPLFYNMSQNPYLRETYYQTDLNGFTFQWYPTGLGSSQPLSINMLPYMSEFPLHTPQFNFGADPEFKKRARLVYEFGASNIGTTYTYPAMARALRNAGFQFAAYFSYDPIAIAAWNTEYPKHFMNLAYTPQQALSLMVAGHVFRDGETGLRISHPEDLAELATPSRFYYSNHTKTRPSNPETLQHIAGFGRSPLVQYDGSGAYFLDKQANGTWRLEVMPDAVHIRNPYQYNPDEKAVIIQWNNRPIQISLPDLGPEFAVTGIDAGNTCATEATNGCFAIRPGVYRLGPPIDAPISTAFYAPPHDPEPARAWQPEPRHAGTTTLATANDTTHLFFGHGCDDKCDVVWEAPFCVTAKPDIYGWEPEFVEFGYRIDTPPQGSFSELKLTARSVTPTATLIRVSLGLDDGSVFGTVIPLGPETKTHRIPFKDLNPVPLARYLGAPDYLPQYADWTAPSKTFDASRIETLRFTIGPGLNDQQKKQPQGVAFERAWLE